MVTFDGHRLPHVSDVSFQDSRIVQERLIPTAMIGHRRDETAGGRVITISGEIRDDPDYVLHQEELRVRADDVARSLDLEDGSATINAKLGNVEFDFDVEKYFIDPQGGEPCIWGSFRWGYFRWGDRGVWPVTGQFNIPYSLTFLETS